MYLDCDWSISVQLIPNRSAKICNNGAKIVTTEEPIKFDAGKRVCKFS